MKPIAEMSRAELAAFVQSHLRAHGIDCVLTGGSAVSIYSGEKYVSIDLDFVLMKYSKRTVIQEAMSTIGFRPSGRHFEHQDTGLIVEFPGGPLSIGRQPVAEIETIEYETGTLRIISATDSVKDRLAAYYYWGDRQALDQAILVAHAARVDVSEISEWSEAEGFLNQFKEIESLLK
jgi:hypothetical protein